MSCVYVHTVFCVRCTCMHIIICIYTHMRVHTHARMHTHTHTHTHTHARTLMYKHININYRHTHAVNLITMMINAMLTTSIQILLWLCHTCLLMLFDWLIIVSTSTPVYSMNAPTCTCIDGVFCMVMLFLH